MSKPFKGFYNLRPGEFCVGLYYEEGGTAGEFMVVSQALTGLGLRLHSCDDGWAALAEFAPILAELDSKDLTPGQFKVALLAAGVREMGR